VKSGLRRTDFSLIRESVTLEKLTQNYADLPMSLTDACLVRLAELNARSAVLTLDGDFNIYRMHGRRVIPTIMPSAQRE
jgi:predicted nucleic acid-binding protein